MSLMLCHRAVDHLQNGTRIMASLRCIVVTPEKTVLDAKTDFIALPLYDGEVGIAPGRAPLIGRLAYGQMRLRSGDTVDRYYVDGGFIQVTGNVVTVLTNRAVPVAEVDPIAARQQLANALKLPASTPELEGIRDRAVAQARGQLSAARAAS